MLFGKYKGKKVTVFSSGMGMPSMGIYSYELFKFYDGVKIIRSGSCGAYNKELNLFDTILVDKSYTEGNFAFEWSGKSEHIAKASHMLNSKLEQTAKEYKRPYLEVNDEEDIDKVFDFLNKLGNEITLNIGGPRESECSEAYQITTNILEKVFKAVNDK